MFGVGRIRGLLVRERKLLLLGEGSFAVASLQYTNHLQESWSDLYHPFVPVMIFVVFEILGAGETLIRVPTHQMSLCLRGVDFTGRDVLGFVGLGGRGKWMRMGEEDMGGGRWRGI